MNTRFRRRGTRIALLFFLLVFTAKEAAAFVLPSDPTVGAGSEWVYDSNLGETHVRMIERDEVSPGVERYRWDMRVAGMRYVEDLELTDTRLGVMWRRLSGFGVVRQEFSFEDPELVMELPLEVGQTWSWSGPATMGHRSGTAQAVGEVVAVETITVPAGTFETLHIVLVRDDSFGTRQVIDLWFDPLVGPIKAHGDLRWNGLIGFFQDLVGLNRFEVELVEYEIVRPLPVASATDY